MAPEEQQACDKLISSIKLNGEPELYANMLLSATDDYRFNRAYISLLNEPLRDDDLRDATGALIAWCCNTDFFDAPASTKFHLCSEHGLSIHSLSVAKLTAMLVYKDKKAQDELGDKWLSLSVICGMFHDLCKVDYYEPLAEPSYSGLKYTVYADRTRDYEHGERSVQILCRFYGDLLPQVAYDAVEWHMGEFDHRIKPKPQERRTVDMCDAAAYRLDELNRQFDFVRILHEADMMSTQKGL